MTTRAAALLVLIAVLAPLPVSAQSASERARRLLEEGRDYRRRGMDKQALSAFNDIVTSFADTDSVDDALLELGRHYMNVEGDLDKARQSFEAVTKGHAQSDGAPGAYYWLGRITLSRATTLPELDDAMAQFTRVQTLYPRSDWVAHALYAIGLVHRKAGRLDEAVAFQRRVVLEYPHSEAAPVAQFEIGLCHAVQGQAAPAMEELQQVRNRFPQGDWPARALDHITALWRLHGAGKPSFSVDGTYSLSLGDILKDVTSILVVPDGTLWLASGKTRSAMPIAQGKPGPGLPLEDPRSLSLTAKGEVVVAGRLAVRMGPRDIKTFAVPGEKAGELEALEKITAAVVLPGGSVLVADEKRRRVLRYDAQYRYQGPFPDAREREVTRLILDAEGQIVALDEKDKSVRVYDVTGRQVRAIAGKGAGYEIKKPLDVAVDAFRNTYIADAEGGVYVFGGDGQLLTVITGELRRPRALALEADGALLVYDDKMERVLRFR